LRGWALIMWCSVGMVAPIEALSRRSQLLDLVIDIDVPGPRWLNKASWESAIE